VPGTNLNHLRPLRVYWIKWAPRLKRLHCLRYSTSQLWGSKMVY
jgi:hypothetical protein